jgi:hypothetical protein
MTRSPCPPDEEFFPPPSGSSRDFET